MSELFDIEKFNILSDDENYYFFRALNMADNSDIENGIVTNSFGNLLRIRTDRERYDGNSKYSEGSQISLEEVFNHCKMHHRTDTNCISLTSNANVALMYGRGNYKDKYVLVKVPKTQFGKDVINAGQYMMSEIQQVIDDLILHNKLDDRQKYYIDCVDYARTQVQLDRVMEMYKQNQVIGDTHTDDIFEKGIVYRNDTMSLDYSALSSAQNFQKNKLVAKLNILGKNILNNVSNRFLVQTLGNVFSSLELIHYKDIRGEDLIEIPSQIVDVFSLLQQVSGDDDLVDELKLEIINYVVNGGNVLEEFSFDKNHLLDEEYTIEKMYTLTSGRVGFYDAVNIYKKIFYLSKSKLRAESTVKLISAITNNNPKYSELIDNLLNCTYGVEPEVFSRQSSDKIKVSESVGLDFNESERELFDYVNGLSSVSLIHNLNNPLEVLSQYLNKFNYKYQDRETFYINALIDMFDWSKLGVVSFSDRQRKQLFNKLKECNVVEVYSFLKEKGINEKDIVNVLLTTVVKVKDISNDININDTFTVEELEDFLGYYKINNTKGLKLRSYQAYALKNIDKIFKTKQFASVVLPTGAGKSFVALAEMLEHSDEEILYLAPNDEILNQIKKYILDIICDEDLIKTDEERIKEKFPYLTLCTYQSLQSDNKNGILNSKEQKVVNNKYDLIVFDELHRTGASEWKPAIEKLLKNQDDKSKVLGITATPIRDVDSIDMSEVWARYFGYTEEEIARHMYMAINMDLMEATRLGYVVNPRVVNCEYTLKDDEGILDNLLHKINEVIDEDEKSILLTKYDDLRRRVEHADGVGKILKDNVRRGGKYIVFCPVVNGNGKLLEDEDGYDTDYRLSSEEVIKKYQEELKIHLGNDYELEFYSMLGEYSKAKNKRELEKFEYDDPEKVKLMVVMNKLNEGVHVDGVDGIIWYRPLDEKSYILFHQQLGRIIYAIDPNEELNDEDRPIVIDLVNNTLRVNLEKNAKIETNDLDKLVLISGWIEAHDYRIPDINSDDSIESRYASSLKRIQGKYSKYLENEELLQELSVRDKEEISAIIELGNSLDLWNVDFPEKIKKIVEKHSVTDISSFELTGILRDFYDLSKAADKSLVMTREEKKLELIKSIHELRRLPRQKGKSDEIFEKVFRDGTNQRGYFDVLQAKINKMGARENLSEEDLRLVRDYEEIMQVLSLYTIKVSSEEKKHELIKTIHELKGLPIVLGKSPASSVRVFRDGTNQRGYFNVLQRKTNKLDGKENLSEDELELIRDYNEIKQVLSLYVVDEEEKKRELIKTIHELRRLPKVKVSTSEVAECVFRNGTNQRHYFDTLQKKAKMLKEKDNLSADDVIALRDYEEIIEVLSLYVVEVSYEKKKEELIKTIHKLGRLPKTKQSNGREAEFVFDDGTDQRLFFEALQNRVKKIQNQKKFDDKDLILLRMYEEIKEVLSLYAVEVSAEEKKCELIKTIHELGRLPKQSSHNGRNVEYLFRDGTDQRSYFDELQRNIVKIIKKEKLEQDDLRRIRDFQEIISVLSLYVAGVCTKEKKEELIRTIHELGRLPKSSDKKAGADRLFRDGTDQRLYFYTLQTKVRKLKLKLKEDLSNDDLMLIRDYEEIMKVLSLYQCVVKVDSLEKKEELIKTIHELRRLPKLVSSSSDISERVFRDNTDQRGYFEYLRRKVDKLRTKENLNAADIVSINDYEEIMQVLSLYVVEVSYEEKKGELIKTIHELKRLPRQASSVNNVSERVFRDGTDQRGYFEILQKKVKKIRAKENLDEEDKKVIRDYEEIMHVLSLYVIKVSAEEKKRELIKTIYELGRLPKKVYNNDKISERVFRDGMDQRAYFDALQKKVKIIRTKENLDKADIALIEDYEEITKVLSECVVEVSFWEKKQELIKTIHELRRLPKRSSDNGNISECIFRDKTDQRIYFDHLQAKVKIINTKKNLDEDDIAIIRAYEEIKQILSLYVAEVSAEEKKQELIKTIFELGRLPKKVKKHGDTPERVFRDGIDQRGYFDNLWRKLNEIKGKENLDEADIVVIRDCKEIAQVLNSVSDRCKYNEAHANKLTSVFGDISVDSNNYVNDTNDVSSNIPKTSLGKR